jgi:hypothetical protein
VSGKDGEVRYRLGNEEEIQMVKVSIEVNNRAARFAVAVRAESIWGALSLVASRYPGHDLGVKFPVDPEGFFVEDPTARAGIVAFEWPEKIAA